MTEEVPSDHPGIADYLAGDRINRAVLDYHINHSGRSLRTWLTRETNGGSSDSVTGVLAWAGPEHDPKSSDGFRVLVWADDRDGAADLLSLLPGDREYFLFGSSLSAIRAAEERWESPDELKPALTFVCGPMASVKESTRPLRAIRNDEVGMVNEHWDLGGGDAEKHLRHKIATWPSGLVEVDGEAVGWSGIHFATDEVMNLGFLFVRPEHRGQGIARDLTRYMIKVVRGHDRLPICHIYADNTPSILMTESEGFEQTGKAYWRTIRPE